MPKLICLNGMNRGDEYSIKKGRNSIGRAMDSDFIIFDKKSSKQHCILLSEDNNFYVQDLGSLNGTIVNTDLVRSEVRSINPGEKIAIGDTIILLSSRTTSDPTQSNAGIDTKNMDDMLTEANLEMTEMKTTRLSKNILYTSVKTIFKNLLNK